MERMPEEQIRVTEDREALLQKLEDYKKRYNQYGAPETQLDTIYKLAVIEPLVENGEVDENEVRNGLIARFNTLDEGLFANAWKVIRDYARTGGANTSGGTGFPKKNQSDLDSANI